MKNIAFFFTIILLICNCKNKQNNEIKVNKKEIKTFKYVNASSGLNYRNSPKGNILGKLAYGKKVEIIKKENLTEKIKDGNSYINGNWVEIKLKNDTAYVFDGYLVTEKQFNTKEYKINNNKPTDNYDLNHPESGMWGIIKVHYKKDSIEFNIKVNNQSGCLSELTGKTKIIDDKAIFKINEKENIKMNFVKNNNEYTKIIITEDVDSYSTHGEGCTFDGVYKL